MALPRVVKFTLIFLAIRVVPVHSFLDNITDVYESEIEPKLLVSEYIKAGKIEQARSRSLVTNLEPNITSYSGFVTVDEQCGSNMFYWFFPSQNDWEKDPLSVWLEGGPGLTTLVGLLLQHGPYALKTNGTLELREYSWNRNSSVIYIDNPVGSGYSYTEKECYSTNQTQIGRNLLNALQQLLLLFPEIQNNPLYLEGESYGGKFVPALAYAIHTSKEASNINLKGIALGNGWVDPLNQMHLSEYLYQMGLVDENQRNLMDAAEGDIATLIANGSYLEANRKKNDYVEELFGKEAGYDMFYNYMYNTMPPMPNITTFIIAPEVREALHVGNATWNGAVNYAVYSNLEADIQKSMRPCLEELAEHYRVVLYNGQLDIIVPYISTTDFLKKMEWSGSEEYKTAKRSHWYVDDELAGYSKTVRNLTEILVRNAGHMIAIEQPKWAFHLYNKLIFNEPF